jgi:hypothetical protein|tara:strand:- start:7396 stop:7818 length:423 start_codon:yes stop_codon:yes gene_type:complete
MPQGYKSKKKIFRESSRLNQRYIKQNHLKKLRSCLAWAKEHHRLFQKEIYFMLWAYDLEFWTLRFASEDYEMVEKKLAENLVYPLVKEGYIYKYFNKLTPSQTMEDHIFREETKYNYRVRYALTQKGRLMVQRLYNKLDS